MNQNTNLQTQYCFNKTNFEGWHFVIENILESNDVLNNVKSDVVDTLEKQLKEARKAETPDASVIRGLQQQLKKAKKNDDAVKNNH